MRCVVDVVVCITGQAKILRRVVEGDVDMTAQIPHVNLVDSLGRRHQSLSPVAEIQTVLRVRKVDGSQIFARGRRGVHNGPAGRQRKQGI